MNTAKTKLANIRLLHTAIWAILAGMVCYIVYAGISGKITNLTYFFIAAILVETIVLIYYSWQCPLTLVARRYTTSDEPNFDIYLPKWLAKHNKTIFGILYFFGVVMVAWRLLNN